MKAPARSVARETASAWLAPLQDWPHAAAQAVRRDGAVMRVVVANVKGSAPRNVGTAMLVERSRILGTIGGGHLEWVAIEAARTLLDDPDAVPAQVEELVLGPQLAQCCGGVVDLWIERYTRSDLAFLAAIERASRDASAIVTMTLAEGRLERRLLRGGERRPRLIRTADSLTWQEPAATHLPDVWIYGAGHVGQTLVRILAELPLSVTWIDSRDALLPHDVPDSIRILRATDPRTTLADAPAGTCFVVMTHSHPLDFDLCRGILARGDQRWVGVIGSQSKGARFRSRLARDGMAQDVIGRLVCPIGIAGVQSKEPGAIAVAVAAQLLSIWGADEADRTRTAFTSVACGDATCSTCGGRERNGE
jgi:xanthine dehydrogenase accessory factor